MSATVLKEFLVKLGFETDKGGMSKFSSSVADAVKIAATMGAAALAAAGAVTAFVTSVADSIDNLADVSGRTGEAASELDKLGYIATLTDSSIEASNASVENLSKNIGDAAMVNLSGKAQTIIAGQKFTQIIIQKFEDCELVETNDLSDTVRGDIS